MHKIRIWSYPRGIFYLKIQGGDKIPWNWCACAEGICFQEFKTVLWKKRCS